LVLAINTQKNLPSTASFLLKATATAIVGVSQISLPILDVIAAKLAISPRGGSLTLKRAREPKSREWCRGRFQTCPMIEAALRFHVDDIQASTHLTADVGKSYTLPQSLFVDPREISRRGISL
jgi:hypothetical protein